MRELKFRCWDEDHFVFSDDVWENEYPKDGDGWFSFFEGKLTVWISTTTTPSDPLEAPYPDNYKSESPIEQYTGLKDKNGEDKEAYDGDLITFLPKDYSTKIPQKAVVAYCEKRACFIASSNAWLIPLNNCRNIEIIGNIHENPELLEPK